MIQRSSIDGERPIYVELLDAVAVAPYLVTCGLLDPAELRAGTIGVVDVSRRNRVFRITRGHGSDFIVKQAVPGSEAAVRHERQVLRALTAVASCELAG